MPPDTAYIPGVTGPPPPDQSFIDSINNISVLQREAMQRHVDSLGEAYLQSKVNEEPQYPIPEWQMFLIVLIIVYLIVLRPIFAGRKEKRPEPEMQEETTDGWELQYDNWLAKYNPYYNSLPADGKKRFLNRTMQFLQLKEFRFHSMVEEEYIPVLISGAAVQMTFGMKNFLMDYFPVIHIIRKEYTLNINKETYYGHVSRSGIYISWNSFLEGYEDYGDSVNVGLHEMAHAVSYDVFLGQQDYHDAQFKVRLEGFAEEGRPVFRAMRKGVSHLLDDYATINFDEFWAVCVETFFENPVEFERTMPDLYLSVCDLLNQNPLKPEKIIDPELAGLAY